MVNLLKKSINTIGTSKFFKAILMTGTTLLFLLKPGISKGNKELKTELQEALNKYPGREWQIQESDQLPNHLTGDPDPLSFAINNVSTYYPDMKNHLITMINSFRDQEQKESTLVLLNQMTENITDPKQKVGAVIYALERVVFFETGFAAKYHGQITDATFGYIETFNLEYGKRFDKYCKKLLKKTEQLKQEILKKQEELKKAKKEGEESEILLRNKQNELKETSEELETTLSKFSPENVKNNIQIRKLIIDTQQRYKDNNGSISPDIQQLFDAVK